MKCPLQYQISETDCVPTTFINAIKFLFERSEIPSEVIKTIYTYSLDKFGSDGERGGDGTSYFAVETIYNWLNEFSKISNFKIKCEALKFQHIHLEKDSKIIDCLNKNGTVIIRICLSGDFYHYVLLTKVDKDFVYIFDPYYRGLVFLNSELQITLDRPFEYNLIINRNRFISENRLFYSLSEIEERECILVFKEMS